jgi:hypothetical protein
MKIYDVPLKDLHRIAKETHVSMGFVGTETITVREKLYRVEGKLVPDREYVNHYQRTSAGWQTQGRKVNGICWHGHRDFMRAVFDEFPNARITAGRFGKTDYNGKQGFEDNYEESAYFELGPQISGGYPLFYQACSCPESGEV